VFVLSKIQSQVVRRLRKENQIYFRVEFRGAILSLVRLSDCGLRWIERHVGADNGYQRYYPTFIPELPCLGVIAGIARDGFVVETNLPSTS
jgi:hypothetical protein